jgi:hypothetical protein
MSSYFTRILLCFIQEKILLQIFCDVICMTICVASVLIPVSAKESKTYLDRAVTVSQRINPYQRPNPSVKQNKIIGYITWHIRYAPEPYRMRICIRPVSDTPSAEDEEYQGNIGCQFLYPSLQREIIW